MNPAVFRVESVDFASARDDLRAVRTPVFVGEQNVPPEIEQDALDPLCHHVLARDAQGRPIGTGRLTPDRRIGRMAVLAPWRGRGVGDALLTALVGTARELGLTELSLHAQVAAIGFYQRHGFLPDGPRFMEAGIEHQTMRRALASPAAVADRAQAVAATVAVAAGTRRLLRIYTRELDPGLLDTAEVTSALRRLAVRGGEIRVLLQDPAAPRRALAPLIGLAQRLPSAFAFRAVEDPVDTAYPSAYCANDRDGWYFRALGHSVEGEMRIGGEARARELRNVFDPVWERSRPCTEFRVIGI